ncbi:hypothetical protein [Aminobacter sp. MDW-2]|uniref:hypothetical protein n=1 Tax=Aminobacter sp. MDW-2 TaxID=2666139 RepID=UPI0012B0CF26|nr:hypothetical protein [Aminobacter sp. MDW-2]MRX32794.1 hypothetical protein [Aminobacter sp. MDW-2]QNH34544.1 hypothetical protein H5P29_00905 [Aminobacter sp. MDW-2]
MAQKQSFLGGLIAGKVIEIVVGKALDRVASNPRISLEPKDVGAVREIVTKSVNDELAQREIHATNAEPVYQSRVAQGALVAMMSAATQVVDLWTNGVPNTPMEYSAPITVLVGGVWALYGRFAAKKPFGA